MFSVSLHERNSAVTMRKKAACLKGSIQTHVVAFGYWQWLQPMHSLVLVICAGVVGCL